MAEDHRQRPRHSVRIVAEVGSDDGGALSVLRDISLSGARLLTNRPFDVDSPLDVHVVFDPDDESSKQRVPSSVVRCTPLDGDRVGIWSHEVAVSFSEELDHLEDKVEALSKRLQGEDWD